MKVRELANHLDQFPGDAEIQCGLSVPSLFINTVANLSISSDTNDPSEAKVVRIIAAAPLSPRVHDADTNNKGAV